MRKAPLALTCLLAATSLAPSAHAEPLARKDVPKPLVDWVDWVLAGHEEKRCPFLQGTPDDRVCVWPSSLKLMLGPKSGSFTQSWKVHTESWVTLPGDPKRWPQEVRVDGAKAPVLRRGNDPQVRLKPGKHTVTGSFRWDALPELLQTPPETGLLSLFVRGNAVPFPVRDPDGRLWVQKVRQAGQEKSRLEVVAHRRVVDDIPLRLITRLQLKVSGKNREVVLGKALPKGFVPMSLTGPLPVRIEPDGRLRVQVRAGTWNIELSARHEGPVAQLGPTDPEGPWDDAEVWVFESRNDLRLVTVEGVSAIDPQQTELPGDWRSLPAYLMRPGDAMKLSERRRGDSDPAPDRLNLDRTFWLDFDGKGMSVQDQLTGTLHRSWRLEMQPRTKLGRAAVGGQDQFITSLEEGGAAGIEIRQGQVSASADSRIEGKVSKVPAVGWSHDFDKVSGKLLLPPGWRLIHAYGVDKASPTWITAWSLLDLFLVLIIGLAVGKLWGPRWGAAALLTMALAWHEPRAPRWAWLLVLTSEGLWRALPDGAMRQGARLARMFFWAALALAAMPFLVLQVRQALYPQLETTSRDARFVGGTLGAAGELGEDKLDDVAPTPKPAAKRMMEMDFTAKGGSVDVAGRDMAMMQTAQRASKSKPDYPGSGGRMMQYYAPDPKSQVNTGPGLPNWSWRTVDLTWQGPVQAGQELRLWLVCPAVRFVLTIVRVALVILLALLVFGLPLDEWRRTLAGRGGWSKAVSWLFPALLLLLIPAGASAGSAPASSTHPPEELLAELRKRLLEAPECSPNCAAYPRLGLEASGGSLILRLEVDALAETAVPLPGGSKQWVPSSVVLDGAPALGLKRTLSGQLWMDVPPGTHQVLLTGPLPEQETVQLPLPLKPHLIEAKVRGWILDGLHEDGLADDTLQLTRIRESARGSKRTLEPGSLPPFVLVSRTLVLGLSWQVRTHISRLTPLGAPVLVEVPLIPGESVMSDGVRVVKGKAIVNLSPQTGSTGWTSTLDESEEIVLRAPGAVPWVEAWTLEASPIWHAEPQGIPAVHASAEGRDRARQWRPWPGESVSFKVVRPKGVPGQTLTIDRAQLLFKPGLRATDASLSLSLRSSRGGQHKLTLPEGADLQAVSIDGAVQPIRQEGRTVTLPVRPGSHAAKLDWREDAGMRLFYRTPEVDLGQDSVNTDITVQLPRNRWTLFVCGPRLGPAVLFWSLLAVFLLVSIGLGRVMLTPLRWRQWFLLSLGLTQVPVAVAGIIALWLVALGWRKTSPRESRADFNAVQALLVMLTVAALACLLGAIPSGLLGLPDMQISGNDSSSHLLKWYQDRSGAALPRAWTLSLPLMLYRGAMLAWALWLATSLLEWLKWGWSCLNEQGLWRPKAPKPARP